MEVALKLLKFHLKRAKQRMKDQADKKMSEREFLVGDLVYLKLQPYRHSTMANRANFKLSAKYFGLFKVIAKIGQVSYKLKMLDTTKIHFVFFVSQLRKHVGPAVIQ